MKLGKGPKRFGGPSDKFKQRRDADKAERQNKAGTQLPAEGGVNIYLDDDRKCPPGWTVVRSPGALYDLIEGPRSVADRIVNLSLDWYLGAGIENGAKVAEWLADRFRADPAFLPKVEAIGLHSSDRKEAIGMFRILQDAIPEDRWYDMFVDTGTPVLR